MEKNGVDRLHCYKELKDSSWIVRFKLGWRRGGKNREVNMERDKKAIPKTIQKIHTIIIVVECL